MTPTDGSVPPLVYLLCDEGSTADEPLVWIHGLADGRRALFAYTSLDRFVGLCGGDQRWTLARTEGLQRAFGPFDVLVLDPPLTASPADAARPARGQSPARTAIPPAVYLPVRGDGAAGSAEVRELRDGRAALLAYTALDRLADSCGPEQPWVVVPTASLSEVKRRQPFDVVIFDMVVPEQYRLAGRIA